VAGHVHPGGSLGVGIIEVGRAGHLDITTEFVDRSGAPLLVAADPLDVVAARGRVRGRARAVRTVGDNDAEKLTKLVIAAAASRQGDDDKPKAAKGKAKAGKAVPA